MKKYLLLVLLLIMFIPFIVNAQTCDTDKITIENLTIKSKSDNVKELAEAAASGKNINLNLSMSEVGDNIEYKLVVKNDSNEDYELNKTSLNINSDYINYSFETDDNSNIVKANSSKSVTLKVEYKTEVPEDKFENGTYNDNKTMTVQLSNGNTIEVPDTIKNPNTGVKSYVFILIILLLISGTIYVLLKKKKYSKIFILIIGTTIIIPISVYALCKCEIKIESNIAIEKSIAIPKYSVGYLHNYYAFYTDSELDNYVKTTNTDCKIVYIGETKYNVCSHIIINEDIEYELGETSTIKVLNFKNFGRLNNCIEQSDESLKCPSTMQPNNYSIEVWHYDTNWEFNGYTFNTNDNEIMNFNNGQCYSDGCFGILAQSTFTMPGHNVLFVEVAYSAEMAERIIPPWE